MHHVHWMLFEVTFLLHCPQRLIGPGLSSTSPALINTPIRYAGFLICRTKTRTARLPHRCIELGRFSPSVVFREIFGLARSSPLCHPSGGCVLDVAISFDIIFPRPCPCFAAQSWCAYPLVSLGGHEKFYKLLELLFQFLLHRLGCLMFRRLICKIQFLCVRLWKIVFMAI